MYEGDVSAKNKQLITKTNARRKAVDLITGPVATRAKNVARLQGYNINSLTHPNKPTQLGQMQTVEFTLSERMVEYTNSADVPMQENDAGKKDISMGRKRDGACCKESYFMPHDTHGATECGRQHCFSLDPQ